MLAVAAATADGDSGIVRASAIPQDRDSKEYADFRDRAAYMFCTGAFPTHLRTHFTALLRAVSRYQGKPASLDGRVGNMHLDPAVVQELGLEDHPMVRKTREFVSRGYKIILAQSLKDRRPFSKVRLIGPSGDKVTVQIDGSLKDIWD